MKRKTLLLSISTAICVFLLAVTSFHVYSKISEYIEKKRILKVLSTAEYQSVFLSMYDVSTFPTEAFTVNRGLPTLKPNYYFSNAKAMKEALESVFCSGNSITNVFLGLDPSSFLKSTPSELHRLLENGWLPYIDANPSVAFDILFSCPSIDYWISLSEVERQKIFDLCAQIVEILDTRDNITMYCAIGEDWLIRNPANYIDSSTLDSPVALKLFLYTFCDGIFQITSENASAVLSQYRDAILTEIASPVTYPDLSQYDIILIGDSTLANATGSFSLPSMLTTFSGATVFNCSQGGASAAESQSGVPYFSEMAADFLSGQPRDPNTAYSQGILDYTASDHAGKKTCFIICFGLNDYFSGVALENSKSLSNTQTYNGAMRSAITSLMSTYQDALYIIMGPGQIIVYNNGTDAINGKDQLVDYYIAASALSEELGIEYIDLYNGFPDADDTLVNVLLRDGVHYSEHGLFRLNHKILNCIADYLRRS